MQSRVYGMVLGLAAVGILLSALLFGLRPQAQEAGGASDDDVSQSELEIYIDTYSAMQVNHDLTLETVIAQKGVSLEQFRNIERRVQHNERLVRKVREALAAQAKARTDAMVPPAAHAEAPPK
jgi:hypothetical protein